MNYEIKKTSFEDALFVRLKIQNSLCLPHAPINIPLFQSPSPIFDVNSLIKSMFTSKQQSFIEKIKKLKTKPSKEQVNQWIAQKQIQIKSMISKEKQLNQAKIISCSDKLVLRPKQLLPRKNCTPTAEKSKDILGQSSSEEYSEFKSQKQKLSTLKIQRKDRPFSQLKLENRKRSITFQDVSESYQKLNQKLLKTPLSRSRKSQNRVQERVNFFQSSFSQKKKLGNSNSSFFQSQIRSQQSQDKGKTIQRETRQRSSTVKQLSPRERSTNRFSQKRALPKLKISTEEPQKRAYKSSLYSTPGLSPLRKYDPRELSPNDKKDLLKKYQKLQSRLDNLLKVVDKQKK